MSTFDDAQRDAADLAKLVNEDGYVETRYGDNPKRSWQQLQDDFDTTEVGGFVAQSVAAADRAEVAADVAMTAGWIYPNIAAGEAERTDGDYFWVVSADDLEVLELWKMGATTATDTGKRTVSSQYSKETRFIRSTAESEGGSNLFSREQITGLAQPEIVGSGVTVSSEFKNGKTCLKIQNTPETSRLMRVLWMRLNASKNFPSGKASLSFVIEEMTIGDTATAYIRQSDGSSYMTFDSVQISTSNTAVTNAKEVILSGIDLDPLTTHVDIELRLDGLPDNQRTAWIHSLYLGDGESYYFKKKQTTRNIDERRVQSNALNERSAAFILKSKNLFNPEKYIAGFAIDITNGEPTSNSTVVMSDFILIDPNTSYEMLNGTRWAQYDDNKGYITNGTSSSFSSNSRAKYLRFTATNANRLTAGIYKSSDLVLPEPYQAEIDDKLLPQFKRGRNLVDMESFIEGYAFDSSGIPSVDNERSLHWKYIPVDKQRQLIGTPFVSPVFVFYDSNFNIVDRTTSVTTNPKSVPDTAAYLRISLRTRELMLYSLSYTDDRPEDQGFNEPTAGNYPSERQLPFAKILNKPFSFTPETIPAGYYRASQTLPFSDFTFTGTGNTVSFLYGKWQALIDANTDYITKTVMGNDSSGVNEFWKLDIKPNLSGQSHGGEDISFINKPLPKIIIVAGVHGFERMAAFDTFSFVKDLCDNWQSDPLLKWLRWNCHLVVVPSGNPWGFEANTRKNYNGVDINRNFPVLHWISETDPSSSTYAGPTPLSEVESQYIDQIMSENTDAVAFYDHHNYFSSSVGHVLWMEQNQVSGQSPIIDMIARQLIIDTTISCRENWGETRDTYCGYTTRTTGPYIRQWATVEYGIPAAVFETTQGSDFLVNESDRIELATEILGNLILTTFRAKFTYD